MDMMARRACGLLLALACVAGATVARAQVLHERVRVGAVRCANGVCWKEGRPSDAAAIVSDGRMVPAPAAGAQPLPGEPVYEAAPERAPSQQSATSGAAGGPPERRERVAMDRETGPEPPGQRVYHEPFNPALFPFKRMSALDAVAPDEALTLAERSQPRQRLRVLGADQRDPTRDAFWGSVVVDFEPGRWVPLPSVAPDARILASRVEPAAEVTFAHDGADNQYVMSTTGGRHRLVWLTDAPQRYFAGEIASELRLADEPRLAEAVPTAIRRRAAQVIARVGVDARPSASLGRALDGLVAWFRAFQPGEPPRPTGSTYLDLALGQRGSCRHRSYAFVITALAMGIPARYVENELHVFVEVMVPRVGWRRINLGGALVDQQVAGADGKVPYRPKGDDPFPRPPAFTSGNDAVPPTPPGLRDAAAADRTASGRGDGSGAAGGGGEGSGGNRGALRYDLDALDREGRQPPGRDTRPGSPGARAGSATVETTVSVSLSAHDSFRGERVDVTGLVTAADGQPGGLPVEIYLDASGGALRVGTATAASDGSWRATIEVPRELPLGDHRVVARTPGDARRRASRSH